MYMHTHVHTYTLQLKAQFTIEVKTEFRDSKTGPQMVRPVIALISNLVSYPSNYHIHQTQLIGDTQLMTGQNSLILSSKNKVNVALPICLPT